VEKTKSSAECKIHIVKIARALNWAAGDASIVIEGDEVQQHTTVLEQLNSWISCKMLLKKVLEVLPNLGQYMENSASIARLCELVEKDNGTTNNEKKETNAMIKRIVDYYAKYYKNVTFPFGAIYPAGFFTVKAYHRSQLHTHITSNSTSHTNSSYQASNQQTL
jgi:hypothetical protein